MADDPIRLNYEQYRAVRRLVHDCCNYDSGNCLALDNGWEPCVCVQSIDYSLVCKWFRAAVLPTDKGLGAALLHRGQARPCAECGTMFVPRSNRGKYCDECAAMMPLDARKSKLQNANLIFERYFVARIIACAVQNQNDKMTF